MDISLVDGYNLPMQVEVIPATNLSIPPNLVNAACIGTAGWLAPPATSGFMGIPNGTYPLPYEPKVTNEEVAKWCPWDLQVKRPEKPGDGVYPYPDDDIKRPVFDPCLSACAAHGKPEDCCQGKYNNPNICKPSLYSKQAKRVCPDAYSFAFDDQTSTFIVPRGSGWRVRFCPRSGRSSNIIQTYAQELGEFGSTGTLRPDALARVMNASYIATRNSVATRAAVFSRSSAALVAVAASVASLFIF